MNNDTRKAKIKWQCRRGMLELDLILNSFVSAELENLSDGQFSALESLLSNSDPLIYHWLLGNNEGLENQEIEAIVKLIRIQTIIN